MAETIGTCLAQQCCSSRRIQKSITQDIEIERIIISERTTYDSPISFRSQIKPKVFKGIIRKKARITREMSTLGRFSQMSRNVHYKEQ